jgi:hypothetical protein
MNSLWHNGRECQYNVKLFHVVKYKILKYFQCLDKWKGRYYSWGGWAVGGAMVKIPN